MRQEASTYHRCFPPVFHMYGTEEKHGLCGNFLGKESLRRTSLHKNRHFMARYHHFLTSSLLFAIRWRTMIISELRRIIGWFWVTQAKKCILCTMYVRKKHNRSGSTSVVVVSKASGKYREIKSGSSEIWSGA